MVDLEDLTEDELNQLRQFYKTLSDKADNDIHQSLSIDEAERLQDPNKNYRNNLGTNGNTNSSFSTSS